MAVTRRCVAVFLMLALTCPLAMGANEDLSALLAGVKAIAAPGVPGPLCVFEERAFPVVLGGSGQNLREPVVVAGRAGRGRVVAFGHDGYLGRDALDTADTGQLMLNAVGWAAGKAGAAGRKPRVAIRKYDGLRDFLKEHDLEAVALRGSEWVGQLKNCDVLCVSSHGLSEGDITEIRKFIRNGGGLITAGLGWGWLQLHPGQTLDEHPGNRLLAPLGIVWADGYLKRTTKVGYAATDTPSEMYHAELALDALVAHSDGETKSQTNDLAQAAWTATRAAKSLPPDDKLLRPRFRRLRNKHQGSVIPTPKQPVTTKRPLDRLLLTLEFDELMDLPPERVTPHPAAKSFPGAVPPGAGKVARSIAVDTAVPGWHGTGLYAAPGQVIVVELPENATGKKLRVRIGAHRDKLWGKDKWRRYPEITRTFPLDQPRTRAANAFGGLIYVDVPKNCKLDTISVGISNGVEAPHFVLGKTGLPEWRQKIRHRPAPWAELASGKIIVTIPSSAVRELDDPEALLKTWDAIADACAELAARPLERKRPERYVADEQISAGYMHAGYPIMTHLDAAKTMTDRDHLATKGAWGLFHELGHNHQSRDWTFAGTGEVTVNLFTLYVHDVVCDSYETCRPKLFGEARAKTIREYLAGGPDFQTWKRKPFLALLMYMQVREAFGWDAYKAVFAEYRDLPKKQRPRNDDEKRDQWLVRLSRTVEHNLGPFFETWGIPTSEAARASIADLPEWMPEGFPP